MHFSHPFDILNEIVLFLVLNQGPIVSVSQFLFLLIKLFSAFSELLASVIDCVKLFVISFSALLFFILVIFNLIDVLLKSLDVVLYLR